MMNTLKLLLFYIAAPFVVLSAVITLLMTLASKRGREREEQMDKEEAGEE
jgi:hypothetical protein